MAGFIRPRFQNSTASCADAPSGLVDGDEDWLIAGLQHLGHLFVGSRQPSDRVDDQHDSVRLVDGKLRLVLDQADGGPSQSPRIGGVRASGRQPACFRAIPGRPCR